MSKVVCNACGLESIHPPTICLSIVRGKLHTANSQIEAMQKIVEAARGMSKHMSDRHELSSCCLDVTPTPAYLLQKALEDFDARCAENLKCECQCHEAGVGMGARCGCCQA